jgi:tetratricopeptide (TPR) repeat protein
VITAVRVLAALLAAAALAAPAGADTIILKNGRVIECDRAWYEGAEVRYQKDGLVAGVPSRLVQKVDQKAPPSETTDPRVLAGRRRLAEGEAAQAIVLFQQAIQADPHSVPALEGLGSAHLKMGDARKARDAADRALQQDERCAPCLTLRGDALMALGDRAGAYDAYQKSLLLRPDSEVERKMGEAAPPRPVVPPPTSQAQFRLQYDGSINEPSGVAVLTVLNEAYAEYTKRLGSSPEKPITVVLQTSADFLHEEGQTPAPGWAEGLNDGTIRVPVKGLSGPPPPHIVKVLRHELAHSFVADRTGGNCPTWLQEGIAQWLEGGDATREDAGLVAAARARRLHPLVTLEGPFSSLSEAAATTAYAESLSAVAHIVRKRGEAGIVRLLAALADGLESEEALPVSLALSYPEFQKSWEEHLLSLETSSAAATPPRSSP